MHVVVDLDGTIDAAPNQMQELLTALKAAGHRITVLTGSSDPNVGPQDFAEKSQYLASLGCGNCWDDMTVLGAQDDELSQAKADYCKSNGVDIVIDNDKTNAAAMSTVVPIVLVPWATRCK